MQRDGERGRPFEGALRTAVRALGLADFAGGALLAVSPDRFAELFALSPAEARPRAVIRLVAVLAAVAGAALAVALRRPSPARGVRRVRTALAGSAALRLAIAGGVAVAVLAAALPDGWTWIGGYDAVAASLQLVLVDVWELPPAL